MDIAADQETERRYWQHRAAILEEEALAVGLAAREPLRLDPPMMDSTCACPWPCRHRRRIARENPERKLQHERLAALTEDDRAWLRANGWTG